MTALAADKASKTKSGRIWKVPVAASQDIFKGAMVCIDADGFLIPAADASGISRVIGIAFEHADNNPGSDGDIDCRVISDVRVHAVGVTLTQAMLGDRMYVEDDATFDDSDPGEGRLAGVLVEFISATEGVIYIPPFGSGESAAGPDGETVTFSSTVTGIVVKDGIVTAVTGT